MIRRYILSIYQTETGSQPFSEWLVALKDKQAQKRIIKHLAKVQEGHLGVVSPLKDGVSEFKLHFGPGYRLYYAQEGQQIILLLCAGDKSTQIADIAKAKAYYADHRRRST